LSGFNFSVIPFCWYLTGVGDVVSSTSSIHPFLIGQTRFDLWKDCEILVPCQWIHFVPQSLVHDRAIFGHFLGNHLFPFASFLSEQKQNGLDTDTVCRCFQIHHFIITTLIIPSSSPDTEFQSSSSSLTPMITLGKDEKPHRVRSRSPVPVDRWVPSVTGGQGGIRSIRN
jgi:hypothetical protein